MMKTWNIIALSVLAGACLWNVAAMIDRVPSPTRMAGVAPDNSVMRSERRMAAVRGALERNAVQGILGYATDLPPDALAGDARGMEEYFLAQFALAPRVLDPRGLESEWIVANLRTTTPEQRGLLGYRVVENCGGGVWLLRKE